MINISTWLKDFLAALDGAFADRVFFVGLQGSYGRGEATETSDIDVVVILDGWEPSDLFQFYRDTKPIRGSLDGLLPLIDGAAVDRAIKIGACNIYHGCVHNMLHEKSAEILRGLYKSASFAVQAIVFRQTGEYYAGLTDLLSVADDGEKTIIETFIQFKKGEAVDFAEASADLFDWVKKYI